VSVGLSGRPRERHTHFDVAHARLGTVTAAREMTRQGRPLGQAQLAVELLLDLFQPVVVHYGSSSRIR